MKLCLFSLPVVFLLLSGLPAVSVANELSSLGVETEIANARASGFRLLVTNTNDDGPGSLRQAIADAAEAGAPHGTVISFHRRLSGKTIELTSGQLEVPADAPPIEITAGDLTDGIILDAGGLSRVFYFDEGTHLRLQGLTITGGRSDDGVSSDTISSGGQNGGGIYARCSSLAIVDCSLEGNRAGDGATPTSGSSGGVGGDGGALHFSAFAEDGRLSMIRTSFTGNQAGNGSGRDGRTIPGGHGGDGGAISVVPNTGHDVDVVVEGCDISNNRAGDGGDGFGNLRGGRGGRGGGLYFVVRTFVSFDSSTVSDNRAGDGGGGGINDGDGGVGGLGGGLYVGSDSSMEIVNSTIVANGAGTGGVTGSPSATSGDGGSGGGIYSLSAISVMHATITGNEVGLAGGMDSDMGVGGGWASDQAGNLLTNSLLAENSGVSDYDGPSLTRSNSLVGGTLDLAPLGDYGGPTPTMPPMLGSPAIDVVSSRLRLGTDQRGHSRGERTAEGGAVELDAYLRASLALESGAPHFVVTRPSDSGPGSLRDALEKAAAETGLGAEHVVITFSPSLRGRTILLRSGALEASNDSGAIHIVAAAKPSDGNFPMAQIAGIALSANYRSRVLETTAGGEVCIAGLTLTKGEASGGGGIWNEGDLFLDDCVISDNRASSSSKNPNGGGIYNQGGVLTLTRCRVSGNVAGTPASGDAGSGGGIYSNGNVIVNESTICENLAGGEDGVTDDGGSGGGIFSKTGLVNVNGSTISSNRAGSGGSGGNGGGIAAVGGSGSVVIYNSTIAENTTGGGRAVEGIGGGIYAELGRNCSATGSTIADNQAVRGGFANTSKGGGIYAEGLFYLTNSILAQNKAISGPNFINDLDSETPTQNNASILGGTGIVLPLGDYGGPTQTMPPTPGSPALAIADPFEGPSVDQRGTFRDQSVPADAGSVEDDRSFDYFMTRVTDSGPDATDVWNDVAFDDWGDNSTYTGLIRDASNDVIGSISARLSQSGVVSGNLVVGNPSIRGRFRGTMAGDGSFVATFTFQGTEYEVNLQLQYHDDAPPKTPVLQLGGTLQAVGGGPVYDLSVQGQRFHPRNYPYNYPGQFTFVIPALEGGATPSGDGYGMMTINTAGRVRVMGKLGDGTRFAQSSTVSGLNTFPLFQTLYRSNPKGQIGGLVRFLSEDQRVNYEGTLNWVKYEDSRESLYPDGFDAECDFVASHYDAPAIGNAILPDILTRTPANAIWKLGGGGKMPLPDEISLTWDERNRIVADTGTGEILRVRANQRTGLVTGIYLNRNNGTRIPFGGAVIQPQGAITGCFAGEGESGFMLICANGVPELTVEGWDSGDSVFFADAGIDYGFSEKQFVVRNTGTATLWSREGFSTLGEDFLPVGNGPLYLAPGQAALLTLRFTPPLTGVFTSIAYLRTNDPLQPVFELDLQGEGVAGHEENDVIYRDWDGLPPDLFDLPMMFDISAGSFDPSVHGAIYQGIVSEEGTPAGSATVRVNPRNGSFSGFAQLDSGRQILRGQFDEDGRAIGNAGRASFDFQVRQTPADFLIQGEIYTGEEDPATQHFYDVLLFRPGFHPVSNPADDVDGRYTFIQPPADGRGDNAPGGSGFGSATVNLGGRIRAFFTMGDGTRFSHSGFLTNERRWPIFQALYGARSGGHVAGEIQFRDLDDISDFDGELSWMKPPNPRDRRYPAGFTVRQVVIGATYLPPGPGENAFNLKPWGYPIDLNFSGGDLLLPFESLSAELVNPHRLVSTGLPTGVTHAGRINPTTGLVNGVYRDRGRGLTLRYQGVIYREQELMIGLFFGQERTGLFDLVLPTE
ncbi:MAG: hypothetical protein KDN19_13740 [Verrucomicrobiae bacterium]|nr:hypothetical protein [Verrucomicrobiae bacterium]